MSLKVEELKKEFYRDFSLCCLKNAKRTCSDEVVAYSTIKAEAAAAHQITLSSQCLF